MPILLTVTFTPLKLKPRVVTAIGITVSDAVTELSRKLAAYDAMYLERPHVDNDLVDIARGLLNKRDANNSRFGYTSAGGDKYDVAAVFVPDTKPADAEWLATRFGAKDEGDISVLDLVDGGVVASQVLVMRSRTPRHATIVKVHVVDESGSHLWPWFVNGARVPTPKNDIQARRLLRLVGVEPPMKPSSNIAAYHWANQSLFVSFNNNTTYRYANVPYDLYYEMCEAESAGSFLAREIKGVYAHDLLTPATK